MFERYTETARRVIFFARFEASQLGSQAIEAEHVLLGLLRDSSLVERLFRTPRSETESIRKEIEAGSSVGEKLPASVDLPLSTSAKCVLRNAADESQRLGHGYIGSEHLLVGILREEKTTAAQILHDRGLSVDNVRQAIFVVQEPGQPLTDPQEHNQRSAQINSVFSFELLPQFNRLVELLVSKGVIGEDEKRHIIGQ